MQNATYYKSPNSGCTHLFYPYSVLGVARQRHKTLWSGVRYRGSSAAFPRMSSTKEHQIQNCTVVETHGFRLCHQTAQPTTLLHYANYLESQSKCKECSHRARKFGEGAETVRVSVRSQNPTRYASDLEPARIDLSAL